LFVFVFGESMCAVSVLNPTEVVLRATVQSVTAISYILFPLGVWLVCYRFRIIVML
jgi:hypothetical protein